MPATPELVVPLIALVAAALAWSAFRALRPGDAAVRTETITQVAAGATALAFLVVLITGNVAAAILLFACTAALIGLHVTRRD